jgi:hypothetical protein
MADGSGALTLAAVSRITEVSAADWDACAGAGQPFISHAFLAALEGSGSVTARTGWLPQHLVVRDGGGRLVACAPVYLKSHSYGEYVFDWGWAEAYERAGGRYYPKLQLAVPFTPVPGRRLLLHREAPAEAETALIEGLTRLAERAAASSVHVTFATEAEQGRLAASGFLPRVGHQYHWHNRGYDCFEDFLSALASRKRKAIRKERATVAESGIGLRTLTGADIAERHWDAFYRFYLDTVDRKWAHAYLSRDFFLCLGATMAERCVMVIAETASGKPVAGAFHLLGDDALYGRYWGCEETYRFLHFEACYYRAIELAIERRLARVEAGAQGEHKIQRGYLPVATYSAHWIADPGLRRAVDRFLDQERAAIAGQMAALAELGPYRCAGDVQPEGAAAP